MAHKKEKETSLPREQNDIFSAKLGRNYAFGREKSGLFWAEKKRGNCCNIMYSHRAAFGIFQIKCSSESLPKFVAEKSQTGSLFFLFTGTN